MGHSAVMYVHLLHRTPMCGLYVLLSCVYVHRIKCTPTYVFNMGQFPYSQLIRSLIATLNHNGHLGSVGWELNDASDVSYGIIKSQWRRAI